MRLKKQSPLECEFNMQLNVARVPAPYALPTQTPWRVRRKIHGAQKRYHSLGDEVGPVTDGRALVCAYTRSESWEVTQTRMASRKSRASYPPRKLVVIFAVR